MSDRVSDIQLLVLSLLVNNGQLKGKDLRAAMKTEGMSKTLPAFYQLMARMEDGGLVKSWQETTVIAGQTFKEKIYEVTGSGERAREEAFEYYDRIRGLNIGEAH